MAAAAAAESLIRAVGQGRHGRRGQHRRCRRPAPYLQGYEAVDSLWLQPTNGNDIGGGKPTLTGPSFVDATNIDKIAGFAANNPR